MASLDDVSSHIDPGTEESGTATAQDQAAGLAETVKNGAASAINSVQNSQLAKDLANG